MELLRSLKCALLLLGATCWLYVVFAFIRAPAIHGALGSLGTVFPQSAARPGVDVLRNDAFDELHRAKAGDKKRADGAADLQLALRRPLHAHRLRVADVETDATSRPWRSLDETMEEVIKFVDDKAMAAGRGLEGMRVCFVAAAVAGPTAYGGLGQAVRRQAVLYAEQGANVDIAYTGGCAAPYNHTHWEAEFARMGITFIPVPRSAPNDTYGTDLMQRAYDVYLWMRRRHSQDGVNYDLVVLHDLQGHGLYVQHAQRAGIAFANWAIVTHAHSSLRLADYFNARMLKGDSELVTYAMERLTVEMADVALSPSEFYYAWMQTKGYDLSPAHVWMRRWTVQLLTPHESTNAPRVFDNIARYGQHVISRKFGYFGRMDRLKGLLTLLDALDHLVAHASAFGENSLPKEVLFVGDSAELVVDGYSIQAAVYVNVRRRKGNWPFSVKFEDGMKSADAVRKFVTENYIVVNPTNCDVASTVTLELLSAGVPVIVTNACAIPELVGDKNMFDEWSFGRGEHLELAHLMRKAMRYGVPVNRPHFNNALLAKLYVAVAKAAVHYARERNVTAEALQRKQEDGDGGATGECPLTIGVATRDRPDYLQELLESLVAQTWYPPGTELLIIDVASVNATDVERAVDSFRGALATRRVATRFARWERPAHISVARNAIMTDAAGTFILFIDDDDIAAPHMVEWMYRAAVRGADVVTGFARNFEDGSNGRVQKHVSLSVGAAHESTLFVHHTGKSNVLVRAQTLREVGGCTLDDFSAPTPFVDWDMYDKLLAHGARVFVVPEVTFLYRMRSRNTIFYGSVGKQDLTHFAHAKRAQSVCDMYGIPQHACAGITAAMQELARPGAGRSFQTGNRREKEAACQCQCPNPQPNAPSFASSKASPSSVPQSPSSVGTFRSPSSVPSPSSVGTFRSPSSVLLPSSAPSTGSASTTTANVASEQAGD